MPKNKLKRFEENLTFANLIQPKVQYPPVDSDLKGKWGEKIFHNANPIVLELGCGRGEYTISLAELFPGKNFIGIDWKGARLWRGAKTGIERAMPNVAFLRIQIQNLLSFFAEREIGEIWITFPVPQMNKTGERKRMTSPRFLDMYRKILADNGIVNLKTDNKPLYEYSLETVNSLGLRIDNATDDLYGGDCDEILSIQTTYEKIWLKGGLKICYLKFIMNEK